ncbi:hypothetical protein HF078_12710 [Bacillus sp. RO2]|uniref:hypothetical protein n=1 Tax=Bacillus sp. RO2 TaxID=2723913 RepID=UPI00145F36A4|nr:hypothetical protein [Bacillus sp. RO2]NMH73945.1 hypothetical protein [Bacillus sp. RO2]
MTEDKRGFYRLSGAVETSFLCKIVERWRGKVEACLGNVEGNLGNVEADRKRIEGDDEKV